MFVDGKCKGCNCPMMERPYVAGEGNIECCKVMVVGTAPGKSEEETGRAFTGKVGNQVREVMKDLKLDGNAFYTNLLKRRPIAVDGSPRKPSRQECFVCASHLMEEVVDLKPPVMILLGQIPTQFFLHHQKVSMVHGLPIEVVKFNYNFQVIPTYDFSHVQRKGGLMSQIGDDWLRDLEEAAEVLKRIDE